MSYDYSENILVQESAGHLLEQELGWQVELGYNQEVLGESGTFGRKSYKDILLLRYFQQALKTLNPWINDAQIDEAKKKFEYLLFLIFSWIAQTNHFVCRQQNNPKVQYSKWHRFQTYMVSTLLQNWIFYLYVNRMVEIFDAL